MFKRKNKTLFLLEEYVQDISQILRERKQTLCTAESCTGGLISHLFTSLPGGSDVFKGGIVAYTWPVKIKLLEIPQTLLEKEGDVTQKVAELMARSVKPLLKADWSLSITGSLMPAKKEVEIGRIYNAVMSPNSKVEIFSTKVAGDSRSEMKDQSSIFCLENLRNKIKEEVL